MALVLCHNIMWALEEIPITGIVAWESASTQIRVVPDPNPTMLTLHVVIDRTCRRERLHANPTDMGLTPTGHMIATKSLLDRSATLGTVADAELLLRLRQSLVTASRIIAVFGAGQAVVRDIAGHADGREAGGTREPGGAFNASSSRWLCGPVNLPAIWRGAVSQVVEMAGDVGCERSLENVLQSRRR